MIEFKRNVALALFTTLKIGGPAEYFFEATTRETLREAVQQARAHNLPVTILGGGSNVLIADEGVRGLVILVRMRGVEVSGNKMTVQAGTVFGEIVARSVSEKLSGLAWAGGLPGTLGGAIFGNAGTFGHAIGDIVDSVEILDPIGKEYTLTREACRFGYRTSVLKETMRDAVILQAVLVLVSGDADALRHEMLQAVQFRNEHHPAPSSAGSFFQNPDAPEGFTGPTKDGHGFAKIPAGWLVEQAGLKGIHVGGAMISEKHANFVVNMGFATARDVQGLAKLVKDRIFEKFGITLEEEVRMLPEPQARLQHSKSRA